MEVCYENFGFYTVDIDYVKHLYINDTQVFYSPSVGYDRKPYLGLLANLNGFLYCIPLTSAKPNQLNWKNTTEHNYLIYENISASELRSNDVYKQIGTTNTYKKLLAVLEIRKMIPVDESLYSYIDFTKIADLDYLSLLQKEYRFLIPHRESILEKAKTLYFKQKETGTIGNCYCNFSLLEQKMKEYIALKTAGASAETEDKTNE